MAIYMFNKPRGCVTARTDAEHRTVMDHFPPEMRESFSPVGRLDIDTTGLLLITDEGSLCHRLTSPEFHIPKTYFFCVFGHLDEELIPEFESGLALRNFTAKPAALEILSHGRVEEAEEYMRQDRREQYMKNPKGEVSWGRLTIYEGKKHQVKRMMKAVGCHILYLKREKMGELALDPELPEGSWRELSEEEELIIRNS